MATAPLVAVEEYLHTLYRPDCDYIDGVVLERNVGQHDHARMQMLLLALLFSREAEWGIYVLPEQRLRVRPGKYRIPDVMVLARDAPRTPIIEEAPLLCIEVVSPEDHMPRILERCWDYHDLGVPEVWIFNPEASRAYVTRGNFTVTEMADDAVLRYRQIELCPKELFRQL